MKIFIKHIIAILFISFGSVFAQNSLACFNSIQNNNTYTVPQDANSIGKGDFNNDGKDDFATANFLSNSVTVLIQGNSGGFSSNINIPIGSSPHYLNVADYNNDGNDDIITSNAAAQDLTVMLGNGSGGFSSITSYSVNGSYGYLNTVDYNNDNNKDIIIANSINNTIKILTGNGNGTFSIINNYSVIGFPESIVSKDFNNDGKVDFAVATDTLRVYLGNGSGAFSQAYKIKIGSVSLLISEDFNNDGNQDMGILKDSLWIMSGAGTGMFTVSNKYTAPNWTFNIISDDFNNDFKKDIAVVGDGQFNVYYSNGDLSFTSSAKYNLPAGYFYLIEYSNFNSDNTIDFLLMNGDISANNLFIIYGNGSNGVYLDEKSKIAKNSAHLYAKDFNNDGETDLAAFSSTNDTLFVHLGVGNGKFQPEIKTYVGMHISGCDFGDFNNDGKMDFVEQGQGNVFIEKRCYLGTGTGSFVVASYATGSYNPISVADFNGDGKQDYATLVTPGYSSVSIHLGTGNGSFVAGPIWNSSSYVNSLITSDFNGDGKIDIAGTSPSDNSVKILFGNGTGSMTTFVSYPIYGATPFKVTANDLNNDGVLDLAVIGTSLSILKGNAGGSFNAAVGYTTSSSANGIVASDINSDGYMDLTVPDNMANELNFYFGNSAFTFSSTSVINLNSMPGGIVSSDFNGDSYNDIAVTEYDDFDVKVLLSQPTPSVSITGSNAICSGQTSTLVASGADSYYWSTSQVSNTITISPMSTTIYSLTGNNFNGCSNTAVKIISVYPTPTISISNTIICTGSSSSINTIGATTYTWSNGATTASITVTPTNTTTYSVLAVSIDNCANSKIYTVNVNNTCQDVWPGDANSDGLADNLDVLELGLHYTQTGTPRASASNNWQSYFSNNWIGTITNGKNLNHSDCNGDGTINNDDTLAIYNNYGFTHAFKPAQAAVINPQLSIVPDQAAVVKGSWGTSSIYLGDATASISNINGVAFTIDFDNTLIETNSIYIKYQNSFLDAGQNLYFRKLDFSNSKLFTASTHTVSNNVSGCLILK